MADSKTIRIYDQEFSVPQPYGEGHTLNAVEAKVLNQCFAENIANNQRKAIKEALDAGTLDAARAAFAEYASGYEFTEAAAGGSRSTMTPLEKEAKKIATALVIRHLKKDGRTKKDVTAEDFDAQVAKVAASDQVQKIAKRRVKEMMEMAELELSPEALEEQAA